MVAKSQQRRSSATVKPEAEQFLSDRIAAIWELLKSAAATSSSEDFGGREAKPRSQKLRIRSEFAVSLRRNGKLMQTRR
jgi:hypothetical protein